MTNNKLNLPIILIGTLLLASTITGCSSSLTDSSAGTASTSSSSNDSGSPSDSVSDSSTDTASLLTSEGGINTTDLFSDRDLEQEADLTDATSLEVTDSNDISITKEGVYVISGSSSDTTITVEAPDDAKVQLVLDGVTITNSDAPAIYVKSADKVFVTTAASTNNTFSVTGAYTADGETNLDAAIFSKSDLVLNGTGALSIESKEGNGITSKDDLKVTGGTYTIDSAMDGLEANDSIAISGGTFTIDSGKDAIHSENEDDLSLGYIYISGGTFDITAADDGIQGTSIVQIDGGDIHIETCVEGIEGTYIIISGGSIDLYATDDGINATQKSTSYDVVIEINGGDITIEMAQGDTDAVDANGSIYVYGGTLNITAQTSSFDYDNEGVINGGTVIVNGQTVTEMPASMMGGGGRGGMGGMKGGMGMH